jgi:hypothetical membrane protein
VAELWTLGVSNNKVESNTFKSVPRLTLLATIAAVVAVAMLFAGVSLAIVSFNHSNAKPYFCWNHFISELGFPGASQRTWLFNGTMVISSLLLLPAVYALSKHLNTRLGYVAAGFGYAACLGACCLGLQGLNQDFSRTPYIFLRFLIIHSVFAAMLWDGCLVALTLFTIVFCRRWKDPASRFMVLVGTICWLAYLAIHFAAIYTNPTWAIIKKDLQDPAFRAVFKASTCAPILSPWLDSHRPRVWWATVFQWGLASSVLLWLGLALVFLWMKTRREPPTPPMRVEESSPK